MCYYVWDPLNQKTKYKVHGKVFAPRCPLSVHKYLEKRKKSEIERGKSMLIFFKIYVISWLLLPFLVPGPAVHCIHIVHHRKSLTFWGPLGLHIPALERGAIECDGNKCIIPNVSGKQY